MITSKRTLPFLVLALAAGTFVTVRTLGTGGNPPTKYEKVLHAIGDQLQTLHFSPKPFDDNFSKSIFKKYLEVLDPDRNIITQSDVKSLQMYETKIDDEIKGSVVQFFPAVEKVYLKRIDEVSGIYKTVLSKPFDFTVNESYQPDTEKLPFAKNESERYDNWRKRLKYMTLERYSDLLEERQKAKPTDSIATKTNAQLEQEARAKVVKLYDRYFTRLKSRFKEEDRFNMLVNIITGRMDPHTNFLPPVDERSFREQMSNTYYGIGAALQEENSNIKVSSLISGSPSWKDGRLQPGDILLKVGQGDKEPEDVTGFLVQDVVRLIRGEKGTEVRLTVKKADGTVKVINLIRDEIKQDEANARSAIIKQQDYKVGYIYLSEFYADFNRANGPRSGVDVAKEIIKLKENNVDAIVMDLRNNTGGSLSDVIQMVGFFIKEGPVVQVKDKEGKPTVLRDNDPRVLYDGPLAVMVNEYSASASEIFAAAIQDYKRGIVIGSTSTYGKGSVQRAFPVESSANWLLNKPSEEDLGALKVTLQKYYRVNGGSTQLRGVSSDIIMPDLYEFVDVREKDDPDALPWDEIAKSDYQPWIPGYNVQQVIQQSKLRISQSEAFNNIHKNAEWIAKQAKQPIPLQLDAYNANQQMLKNTSKQTDSLVKLKEPMLVSRMEQDANKFNGDKEKDDRYNNWLKAVGNDIYIKETLAVVGDMIKSRNAMALNQ